MEQKNQVKILDEIVGKEFLQHCGDTLIVLNETNGLVGNKRKFKGKFKNHPYEIWGDKYSIIKGLINNPQIELDKYIGQIFPQKCGDSLLILEKIVEGKYKGKWKCEFQKYSYIVYKNISDIKRGTCLNPLIEENEFIGKIFPQHCGDSVLVLEKTNKRNYHQDILYKIQYQKYKYEELKTKSNIKSGICVNPLIEKYEFIGQIFPQKYGEKVLVLNEFKGKGPFKKFKIQFQEEFYEDWKTKNQIISGRCINPKMIEKLDKIFMSKEYMQNCGDSVKVIEKTNKKKGHDYLYKIEFQKYKYIDYKSKGDILRGNCDNPNLPQRSKNNLLKFIKENFKNKKPTYKELANLLSISYGHLVAIIIKYNLKSSIKISDNNYEESILRNFIKNFYKGKIINNFYNKNTNYKEIDIYLPEISKGYEYNGSIWHEEGNPNNKFSKPIGYHKEKKDLFKSLGIDIDYIWDKEWFSDFPKNKIVNKECQEKVKNSIIQAAKEKGREDLLIL